MGYGLHVMQDRVYEDRVEERGQRAPLGDASADGEGGRDSAPYSYPHLVPRRGVHAAYDLEGSTRDPLLYQTVQQEIVWDGIISFGCVEEARKCELSCSRALPDNSEHVV